MKEAGIDLYISWYKSHLFIENFTIIAWCDSSQAPFSFVWWLLWKTQSFKHACHIHD